MVEGVRMNGAGAVERVVRATTFVDRAQVAPTALGEPSTVATMAAQGAPVDASRVAAIRAAITDGSYKVDPDAIATRMIEIDLPK